MYEHAEPDEHEASHKLVSFLRIKTHVLKRLLAVTAFNGATHSQKDCVGADVGGFWQKC